MFHLQCQVTHLPITLWTDLGNKEPPFVEETEGGMFMSINWNLTNLWLKSLFFNYRIYVISSFIFKVLF